MPEMGENLVGCYLKLALGCEIVVYNQRISRQGEVDVIGIDLDKKIIYLCEVTTHIRGVVYGKSYQDSIEKIRDKFIRDIKYSKNILKEFKKVFMYWAPNVPSGIVKLLESYKKELLKKNIDFRLVINKEYTECVRRLEKLAKEDTQNRREPFYRALQILGHLRKN